MNKNFEIKIIDLFRKVICSLTCIQRITKNKELRKETNKYLEDLIVQYNKYLCGKDVFAIEIKYNKIDLIDFSDRCIFESKEDVVRFAEDLQYGFIELIDNIIKERKYTGDK